MAPTTGIGVDDRNLESQIENNMGGCMAGFFNLFDRHRFLPGKRLPSSALADSASELEYSVGSPVTPPRDLRKTQVQTSPKCELRSPAADSVAKSPLPFDFKEAVKSPWLNREAPRLSLDSRVHPREMRRDYQSRSPSIIARLMGLDSVTSNSSSSPSSVLEAEKKVELRRSASESRSRDYCFFDAPSFLSPKCEMSDQRNLDQSLNNRKIISNPNSKNQNLKRNQRRMRYYNTADFFPPEKYQHHQHEQEAVTIYGEIERRLRMRGIDEPSKDLETLTNVLEALQLKGLLHSSSTTSKPRRKVVSDRRFFDEEESPIVLLKPARIRQPESPRRERPATRSPGRIENRSSVTVVRRKGGPLSIETQRRGGDTTLKGSHSPAQSPKKTRRSSLDQTVNQSPRGRRSTVETSHKGRERAFSTCPRINNERRRVEEYKEGKNLLERCDKLLHTIVEMTSNSNSTESPKPSPVSVLDSSFYKEDESSPSPVKQRTIDFKDLEDDQWSPPSSSSRTHLSTSKLPLPHHHHHDMDSTLDGSDFGYISEVLKASSSPSISLPLETDLFLQIEQQSFCSKDKSKASILQKKLIFDGITQILDRACLLPPWKAVLGLGRPTVAQVLAEFQRIQDPGPSQDLLEVICGALKKDLAGDSVNGWGHCHVEMSEMVLDIERLIFKDLISDSIGDLATFSGTRGVPRRRLVF